MAITSMTVTTGAVFIPEVWSAEVLRAVRANLVLADKVHRYDADVKAFGDKIHIPNVSNLSVNQKTAGNPVTIQAPTEGEVTIDINQHWESSFEIEDILKIQSRADLMGEYTNAAGYAIAQKIDTDLAGLYSGLTQYVGDGSTDITDANIVAAIEKLDEAGAPQEGRVFVIRPSAKAALLLIDKFVLASAVGYNAGNSPIVKGTNAKGYWGEIYGIPVYVSSNLVTEAGSPSKVHNLMFHKDAFGLAMQESPRTQSFYDQKYLATLVTVDTIYGFAEIRDTWAVDFRTKA